MFKTKICGMNGQLGISAGGSYEVERVDDVGWIEAHKDDPMLFILELPMYAIVIFSMWSAIEGFRLNNPPFFDQLVQNLMFWK